MKIWTRVLLILIFLITTIQVTYSHSGGTNSSGCHTNHSTGDYHCHNAKRVVAPDLNFLRSPSSKKSESNTINQYCCKVCTKGKACGDTCISRSKSCYVGAGCACDG